MVDIAREALRQYQELTSVIDDSVLIGGVYHMDYDECVILSNDKWKQDAGGVPEHCFLLATSAEWEQKGEFDDDEAYAILLRAQGPAELTNEQELMEVRQRAMREMITGNEEEGGPVLGSPEEFIDILTQNEIQYSGIKAKILGTFYQQNGELKFGNDIDTFFSAARYAVYKPQADALARIASYPVSSDEGGVPIGKVQYSSTQMRPSGSDARVRVPAEDFVGNKTAVFGMTRTGKSNTMKIIATATHEHAILREKGVGQLLFDPQGEYANPNQQDDMSLFELGSDAVTVYKFGARASDSGTEPLQVNFFEEDNIEAVWSRIKQQVPPDSKYIERFLSVDVVGPSENVDRGGAERATRRRSALYATLVRAGFEIPDDFKMYLRLSSELYDEVEEAFDERDDDLNLPRYSGGKTLLHGGNLLPFWEVILSHRNDIEDVDESFYDDGDLEAILEMFAPSGNKVGYNVLTGVRKFHDAGVKGDYAEKIYADLRDGKIAIIDMSLGLEEVVKDISDRVVKHVLQESLRRFTAGEQLPDIQIFLEEAHRLFGGDRYDDDNDPYVRLAKEGAKFNLGLIYATQEVTSVNRRVLANTANWVVTHLNSKFEVNELAKYYNFGDFKRPIREIDDKGFARIKMQSGKYIVPTKIDLFDASRIEQARKLAEERGIPSAEVSEPDDVTQDEDDGQTGVDEFLSEGEN